jgi:hypothetical protein
VAKEVFKKGRDTKISVGSNTVYKYLGVPKFRFGKAEEKNEVRIQGKVMELDVMKKTVIVNEKTFAWDQNTLFFNEKGSPITADKLTLQSQVSIEATRVKSKPSIIKKIYLLSK